MKLKNHFERENRINSRLRVNTFDVFSIHPTVSLSFHLSTGGALNGRRTETSSSALLTIDGRQTAWSSDKTCLCLQRNKGSC